MDRRFENIDVQCWVHAVKLGTSKIAVCLFQARAGNGLAILEALGELNLETLSTSKRTIAFSSASEKRISTLRLRLVESRDDLRAMHISVVNDVAMIEMTDAGLEAIRKAFQAWCEGGEDFCVSPRQANIHAHSLGSLDVSSAELWFWGPSMTP